MIARTLGRSLFVGGVLLAASAAPMAHADEIEGSLETMLQFEAGEDSGKPKGWDADPVETMHLDTHRVHTGAGAARIERNSNSDGEFTLANFSLPADFQGKRIEFRGFLRSRDLDDWAGLWMRIDGDGKSLAFDNMRNRPIRGDNDWAEYKIRLPIDTAAKTIVFGALLAGNGRIWVDDFSLWVDGKPLAEAAKRVVEKTVLDSDTEFDQGSGVSLSSLTPNQIQNLALLGRIWGFVKYHHPAVATGKLHWDYELFRILPAVLAASDSKSATDLMANWLQKIGTPDHCAPCAKPPTDAHLLPRLDWIDQQQRLGTRLTGLLKAIYINRIVAEEQFFVTRDPDIGNPHFDRELNYSTVQPLDTGYRILALFRLWNIIEYWFPYRNQITGNWADVMLEFLPRFAAASHWDTYQLELLALITRIGDGHANIWSALNILPPRGECHLPVYFRYVEDHAVVVGTVEGAVVPDSGLRTGDVVLAIDGTSVESMIKTRSPYYSASNEAARLGLIMAFLPRGKCAEAQLLVERNARQSTISMQRSEKILPWGFKRDRPGTTFQLLSDQLAYLKLSSIKLGELDTYLEKASNTRGLIIDIRNYPSEFSVFALGSRLLTEPTAFVRFTNGDLHNPGAFIWSERLQIQPQQPAYQGQVVILVDDSSMSSAEYTAMAFRSSPQAIVMGSTTAGADGNTSSIPLPGGLKTSISGIGIFYPDKTPTQRIGIVPDIVATPTIKGIREGRDEVLERAIRYLLGPQLSEAKIRQMASP